jgi:histidinol-phosphate aminotransferase
MNTISISRRDFARLVGACAAAAVVRPPVSFAKPTQSVTTPSAEGGVVRLSANENPYGPSPKAFQAITDSFGLACRYPDDHNNVLIDKLAKLNGLNHDQILLGDGSGEILLLF